MGQSAALTRLFISIRRGRFAVVVALAIVLGLAVTIRAQNSSGAVDLEQIRLKAEQPGDPDAQNSLGNAYTNGIGVKQDFAEALKWYRRAAEKGFAPAQFNLGLVYEAGRGVPADDRQAVKYYLMAAEQGFAPAQFNVGNMYFAGRGVGKDLFEANLWFKQAAEKGVLEAQYNLGLAYETGRGVRKDETQAARWYKQAADRGYSRAQHNLGLLLENGFGVPQNEAAAAALYRAAAQQGLGAAQNNFGVMLAEGRGGLEKDPLQALVWLRLAVKNGAKPEARDFLIKNLTPEQLANANALWDKQGGVPLAFDTEVATSKADLIPRQVPASATSANPAPATSPDVAGLQARLTELTQALNLARQANSQYAEFNQRLELEKARLEQELTQGSESSKLIEPLRAQSRRLAEQVQTLTTGKEIAEREVAVLSSQIKGVREELSQTKSAPLTAAAPPAPVAASALNVAPFKAEIVALTGKLNETLATLQAAQQTTVRLTEANVALVKEKEALQAALNAPPIPTASTSGREISSTDKDAVVAGLQRDNARLNEEVKRSTVQLLSLNTQLRGLRAQIDKGGVPVGVPDERENTAAAEMRTQKTEVANKQLQAQHDAAVSDAENVTIQFKSARDEITRLTAEIRELHGTRQLSDLASDQLGQYKSRLDQAAQETARLQADNQRLAALVTDFQKQNTTVTASRDMALKTELAQAQVTVRQLQQQLSTLQTEKNVSGDQSQTFERKLAEKSAEIQTAESGLAAVREELAQANNSVAQLTQENERLQLQVATIMRNAKTAEGIQDEVARLRGENQDLLGLREETVQLRQAAVQAEAVRTQVETLTREHEKNVAQVATHRRNREQAEEQVAKLEKQLIEARTQGGRSGGDFRKLQADLTEASQVVDRLSATVAEQTAENDRLQQKLTVANQAAAAGELLKSEVTQLHQEKESLVGLRTQTAELSREREQLAAQVATHRRERDQAKSMVSELEETLLEMHTNRTRGADAAQKLQVDLREANQTVDKLNATIAELTSANDTLEKDLDNARKSTAAALAAQSQAVSAAQPDAYKMEISTLQGRVKEMEAQNEDERSQAAQEVATLAAQLARVRETNKSLTEANRALLSAKQSDTPMVSKNDFDQLQAQVRELKGSADESRRQVQSLTEVNQRLTGEREDLRRQLVDARQVATVLPGLSGEKAALEERLEAVGAQLLKAQQEIDTLQKENADATAQAVTHKQAVERAQTQLTALQTQTNEVEQAAQSHNSTVAELTALNAKLEVERSDLRKQMSALRADNARLGQTATNIEQLKADGDRSAQQNIDTLSAQLTQVRRDLQSARDANSRLVEGNVNQERNRAATLAQLRQENAALSARLTQAQGTLDQIASAARLGTPAAVIASGGSAPVRTAVPVATTAPEEVTVRYHTVGDGDSLSRISMRYYGTPNRWQDIFQANRDVLQGSSALRVGMQLRIP